MDKVNAAFQELLAERKLPMKVTKEAESFLYQGKLALMPDRLVDFTVSLDKGDQHVTGQIVFNNLAYCSSEEELSQWLLWVNKINVTQGLYYYFGIDADRTVFARHIGQVSQEGLEAFFYILTHGGKIVRSALGYLEEQAASVETELK